MRSLPASLLLLRVLDHFVKSASSQSMTDGRSRLRSSPSPNPTPTAVSAAAADEIVEHTLAQIQECYLFELPPRVRAQGWLAADMTKQMWTGKVKVVQRGNEAAIMLVDRRDGKLFAICKVEEGAVERVSDSSRYFVIKIQNAQGRHAFVGLAFDDRNEAFDFNVALQEFQKDVERSAMLERGEGNREGLGGAGKEPAKATNLSLKEGQKIKISIGGSKASSRPKKSGGGPGGITLAPPPGDSARRMSGSGGGSLLAPPPGDTRRARGIARPSPVTASTTGSSSPPTQESYLFAPSATNASAAPTPSATNASANAGGGGVGGSGQVSAYLGMSGGGPSGVARTTAVGHSLDTAKDDDDPLGLGLGSAAMPAAPSTHQNFSEFSPPPPTAQRGLSDMSGLGLGLPYAGGVASAPAPGLLGQQQNLAYSQDQFSQPQAFPPAEGVESKQGFASGVRDKTTTASDDPFGLF